MVKAEFIAAELKRMAGTAGSQKLLAGNLGFPESLISSVINGGRMPPRSLLDKLGYEAVTLYRKKEKGRRSGPVPAHG